MRKIHIFIHDRHKRSTVDLTYQIADLLPLRIIIMQLQHKPDNILVLQGIVIAGNHQIIACAVHIFFDTVLVCLIFGCINIARKGLAIIPVGTYQRILRIVKIHRKQPVLLRKTLPSKIPAPPVIRRQRIFSLTCRRVSERFDQIPLTVNSQHLRADRMDK